MGALKHLKEQNPKLMIAVCGCMPQQEHVVEKFKQSFPFVDIVFGTGAIDLLPELLCQRIEKRKRVMQKPVQRTEIVEQVPIKRDSA